jgi:small subunit ribosomal protein S6
MTPGSRSEGRKHVPLRAYELMIIVDQDADDAANDAVLARVREVVESAGGSVPTVDKWGRRRFAYPINHKHEGVYTVLEIVTPAANLDEVDRFLRLADDVVRHKLIRLPDSEATKRGLLTGAS